MAKFWAAVHAFLGFLKGLMPLFAQAIYHNMKHRIQDLEIQKMAEKLKIKYLKNRVEVEKDNRNKSDADVIKDAISEGRRDHRD